MDSTSTHLKKVLRSRSRSRSKEHQANKSTSKVPNEPKAKFEEEKKGSSPDKELEQKFKDFEAEIHAIDPSNKSEKNETKKQKTFETPENLILLYNKRIYVEGFPVEGLANKDQAAQTKEDFKDLFKDAKEIAILTPSKKEGNPLLLIDFERRESLDSALKLFQNYKRDGVTLRFLEALGFEEKYSKQVIEFSAKNTAKKTGEETNECTEIPNVENNTANPHEEKIENNSKENSKENSNEVQSLKQEIEAVKPQENDPNFLSGQDLASYQNQPLQYYSQYIINSNPPKYPWTKYFSLGLKQ